MKKLPALLYGWSCRAVIVLKPTGESQIQNRGVTNTNKDCEGNTKIVTAHCILISKYFPTIFLCFIANNNCSIFRNIKCLILIFVSAPQNNGVNEQHLQLSVQARGALGPWLSMCSNGGKVPTTDGSSLNTASHPGISSCTTLSLTHLPR